MPTHSSFTPFIPDSADDPSRRISSIDPKLSRSNYFDGKLLRASDLIRDQLYLDERLREAGRAVGEGIVRGFDVALSLEGDLTVAPGVAIAPSGRILEHEGPAPLVVNLFDTAQFAALNPGGVDRLDRGLYAVAARLTRRGDGAAEVFPRDLAGDRRFEANAFTEGVELVLVPLDRRLPGVGGGRGAMGAYELRGVADRAALARDLLRNPGQPPELDADAVALALLAVDRGGPAWIDLGLVRRPQRAPGTAGTAQADLMAHHAELLAAIVAERQAAGRTGAFAARDYFDRLPPAGQMPPTCVDPAAGVQRFFPPEFDVQIAPVRADDLPAILAEAALLDPIALSGAAPADVMILVPLSDGTFDGLARRLEYDPTEGAARDSAYRAALEALDTGDADAGEIRARLAEYQRFATARAPVLANRLPSLGALTLRARGTPPALDTDVAAWASIHAEAQRTGRVWFVRRAPRAAATDVTAVLAARGHALPPLSDAPPTDVADLRAVLAEAERDRDAARAEATERAAMIEALRERLADSSDASGAALTEAREEVARLEARLAEAQGRADRLAEAAEDARRFERERDAARAELERLRRTLDDAGGDDGLRRDIDRLEATLAAERDRIGRLEATAARITAVERERDAARAELEQLRAGDGRTATTDLRDELRRLERDFATANRRLAEAGATEPRRFEIDTPRTVLSLAGDRDADAEAVATLRDSVGRSRPLVMATNVAVAAVDPRYDAVLWQTLAEVAERGQLEPFAALLRRAAEAGHAPGLAVAARGADFGIPDELRDAWANLDLEGGGR